MPWLDKRITELSSNTKSSFGRDEIGVPLCSMMSASVSPYENGPFS